MSDEYEAGRKRGRDDAATDIEELAFALVQGDDAEGTALTAAVLQRAAQIARGGS